MPHRCMPFLPSFLLLLPLLSSSATLDTPSSSLFSRNDTDFQHLVLHPDPRVARVYVGARDRLFQLRVVGGPGGTLRLEQEETTGPVSDSKDCLPPVTPDNCPQGRRTSNHNKLLLVNPGARELITCGSVLQGTCQTRSLSNISQVLYSAQRPVDTQYVAANDPAVSTVGLVVHRAEGAVLYVGRGYTSGHPPISTRHLDTAPLDSAPLFSYEETAKLGVAGRLSEYDHHFVAAFSRRGFVYFLFYRRDIKAQTREYSSFAARVCTDDSSYYSYVEVPLVCRSSGSSSSSTTSTSSSGRVYNLLQAAQVGEGSGGEGQAILGVFSSRTGVPGASALCQFPLEELDQRMDWARDLCYTQHGRAEDGAEGAYIEYEVKSSCANLPQNTLKAYPCGSDHTPSPMASRVPLEAEAVLVSSPARLTAVAVSVREGHSIAFLGDELGNLHKVFLGPGRQVERYSITSVQPGSAVHPDLLLDSAGTHIYIMTTHTVERRAVAECDQHLDCASCLQAGDPYCGWCILEGRCVQGWQCPAGPRRGQWLWSFDRQQSCLSVQLLSINNISRGERAEVVMSVPALPSLSEGEFYSCFYQDSQSPAYITNTGVTCSTPDANTLPPIGQGQDSVTVSLSLRFLNVTLVSTEFTFYSCELVQELAEHRPCRGCVSSRWGCNWCLHQHLCTHKHTCDLGLTIHNQQYKPPSPSPPPPTFNTTRASSPTTTTTQDSSQLSVPTSPLPSPPPRPQWASAQPTSPVTTTLAPHPTTPGQARASPWPPLITPSSSPPLGGTPTTQLREEALAVGEGKGEGESTFRTTTEPREGGSETGGGPGPHTQTEPQDWLLKATETTFPSSSSGVSESDLTSTSIGVALLGLPFTSQGPESPHPPPSMGPEERLGGEEEEGEMELLDGEMETGAIVLNVTLLTEDVGGTNQTSPFHTHTPDPDPNTQPNTHPISNPDPDPDPDPNTQPNTHPISNPDPDPDPNTHPNTHPISNPDPNTHPNTHPISNPDPDSDPDPNTHPISNPDPDSDPDPKTQPISNPDPDPDPNTHPNTHPISNLDPDPDPNTHLISSPNPDTDPNTHPISSPNPDTEPNTHPISNLNLDPNTQPISNRNTGPNTHPISNPDPDPNTHPISSSNPDTHPNTHLNTHPIFNPDLNPNTQPLSNHNPDPGSDFALSAGYQSDPAEPGLVQDCPCVEEIQGSSLLPVNVQRKISLIGRHLHLFQDEDLDYECVLEIEGQSVVVEALVETDDTDPSLFIITCQLHKYSYAEAVEEYKAVISVRRKDTFQIDSPEDLQVTLFNCSVGRWDCSRCLTAAEGYGCVWCGQDAFPSCAHQDSCLRHTHTCPAPTIHYVEPASGPVEGGTRITISGSNLGQQVLDIQDSVMVAGVPCLVLPSRYEVSSRIVCETTPSGGERRGQVSIQVRGGNHGLSTQSFSFQDPVLTGLTPQRGPRVGGSTLSILGERLRTGHPGDISVLIGGVPCHIASEVLDGRLSCVTGRSNITGEQRVTVRFGRAERHLQATLYHYTPDPNITSAAPSKSFLSGGRVIRVSGQYLDVVQDPRIRVTLSPPAAPLPPRRRRRSVPEPACPEDTLCHVQQYESSCAIRSSSLLLCPTPAVGQEARHARVQVDFLFDSLHVAFGSVSSEEFSYEPNPVLYPLNQQAPSQPYHHKPGSVISVEGENLDLAINKEEVLALIGGGVCSVKTLTHTHLYCEPPPQQPSILSTNQEGMDTLPEFTVQMGKLNFSLGRVQYDSLGRSIFPLEAQVGLGVGASVLALLVIIILLIYRRKSKQAMRDYKKVQIQLENLETSVRDRCKKEFTDLMTEMMDVSSDLGGSGIPFLDYGTYAERIFFPGHRDSPLRRELDVPEARRPTVEQGLVQLSHLLNSKLFLTTFIHTLEIQRTFSPRDRAYMASLLTVALHGKLEYFTDILKTLLNDLVEQYVAKNPKLMLRRTESVVEKLLTNWMSICLFTFLRDSAGEAFYMLFRAIKHQVDKGPVDAVTGKAKYTLNDNRLLREDVEYHTLTLNVLMPSSSGGPVTTVPVKVLDCDTITQVKEKVLDQTWKGTSFSQRPQIDALHLEWRAGVAGHLILSDEDLTSVMHGSWKRLNTLQHYKVPDGATVTLVTRNTKHLHHDCHDYAPREKTPMMDDGEEGGVRLWHLVKASEEAELPKQRGGSMRERGGAKAIPEIYLTRLLSMKGTLQKFVDDLFTVILSTSRPVPLALKYYFDLLDEQAVLHNICDPDTIHIWKTNSLPLRFWINILKNPQFIFDVQASDHVDAVLSVIAQTFMDSCTLTEHKLGRDSPINKLLYARDIPRYKQMVERYYADIRQTISASDQEMNSALAELSRNYSGEVNFMVALHELYKYINKYYDQIITALEEDPTAQKMQLACRLQQIAAAVENKVTDL